MTARPENDQLEFNFEAVARDDELQGHEGKHPELLAEARNQARQFALSPYGELKYGIPYSCTIEDVRELLDIQPAINGRNKWLGAVFCNGQWTNTGRIHRKNKTRGCHGRPLPIWQLNSAGEANMGVP